jgi:hypothetical protein
MKIKCINCNSSYEFENASEIPSYCEHCNEDLEPKEVSESEVNNNEEIVNLKWTKQRDSSFFNVSKSSNMLHLIGRMHHGSELLCSILENNIPIISKTHCSVEFLENNVYLKDEGSTNGTFWGYEKISCTTKKLLKDNQLVWLANELFIVTFEFKREVISESKINNNTKYRCKDCGQTFDTRRELCPKCEAWQY